LRRRDPHASRYAKKTPQETGAAAFLSYRPAINQPAEESDEQSGQVRAGGSDAVGPRGV
jgi:hypothetical protein